MKPIEGYGHVKIEVALNSVSALQLRHLEAHLRLLPAGAIHNERIADAVRSACVELEAQLAGKEAARVAALEAKYNTKPELPPS